MRLGITTFGCDAGRSGIGRYLLSMLDAPLELPVDLELCIWSTRSESKLWSRSDARVKVIEVSDRWSRSAPSLVWHLCALPTEVRRAKLDALWLPAANRRLPWKLPCPTIGTVHDLGSLHVTSKYSRVHDFYVRHLLPRLIRQLDFMVTVSDYSRQDIIRYAGVLPETIATIPLGVDPLQFCVRDVELARQQVLAATGCQQPYLIYVSRLEHPAKNHVGLIDAFEQLQQLYALPHKLLLVGPDWNRADVIHERIAKSSAASKIQVLGYAPQELLPALYQAADLCVIPSLHEGFGLPVIEAMACGVPVAIADCTSLPEVAGNAALKFDPSNSSSMAKVIYQGLTDSEWRRAAVVAGIQRAEEYRWSKTAFKTLQQIAATTQIDLRVTESAQQSADGVRSNGDSNFTDKLCLDSDKSESDSLSILNELTHLNDEVIESFRPGPFENANTDSGTRKCLETHR